MINFRCHVAGTENPFESASVEVICTYSKDVSPDAIKLYAINVQYALLNDLQFIPKEVDMAQTNMAQPSEIVNSDKPKCAMRQARRLNEWMPQSLRHSAIAQCSMICSMFHLLL